MCIYSRLAFLIGLAEPNIRLFKNTYSNLLSEMKNKIDGSVKVDEEVKEFFSYLYAYGIDQLHEK